MSIQNGCKEVSMSSKIARTILLTAVSAICAWASSSSMQPANAEIKYEKLVEINAEEMKGYLNYPNSGLSDFFHIVVKTGEAETGKAETPYEDLVACKVKSTGKAEIIACRRLAAFDFNDKQVKVKVKLSSQAQNDAQVRALAAAIPHLVLELFLKDNFVGGVYVPTGAYESFKSALATQGFTTSMKGSYSPRTSVTPLVLQSEPAARFDSLSYQPSLKK